MRWLRTFWITLGRACSEPAYYHDVLAAPLRFSLKFAAATTVLTALVATLAWRVHDFPQIKAALTQQVELTASSLPENASLMIGDGAIRTQHLPLPFHVPSTPAIKELTGISEFAVIIDEGGSAPGALLTLQPRTLLVHLPADTNFRRDLEFSYADLLPGTSVTISRASLISYKNELLARVASLTVLLQILTFPLLWLSVLLASVLPVVILTLFSQIGLWLAGLKIAYRRLLRVSLVVMAISLLVSEMARFLFPHSPSVLPFAFFGMMGIIMIELRKEKSKG